MSSSPSPAVLATTPALPPPPGEISNFVNPENHGPDVVIIGAILIAIMVICVAGRVYTKIRITRASSWDDVSCVLASLGAIAYYGSCVFASQQRIGIHQWNISVLDLASKNFLVSTYLVSILVQPTMLCTKLTFFLLYLQIFRPNPALRLCIYAGAVVMSMFYLGFFIVQMIFLTPQPSETWLEHYSKPFASGTNKTEIPLGAFGVAIDFYILLLPIAAIIPLQLPPRKKFGLILIFMTGFMACISSILSLAYRIILIHSTDSTWYILPTIICALTEFTIGIIVSCISHLVSLVHHHKPHLSTLSIRVRQRFAHLSIFSRSKSSSEAKFGLKNTNTSSGGASDSNLRKKGSERVYLETKILGSIRGNGTLFPSSYHPMRDGRQSSFGQTDEVRNSQGVPTRREAWD